MTFRVGYHASHEQFAPGELLDLTRLAEQAGFQAAMCSDHLAPFSERQGNSGLAWSWLGAALATTNLTFGTVNAPGQRYHPVIIAQGIATLAEMFPGRFWVALGSGQLINEHVTGTKWPPKEERNRRLMESQCAIRALLAGETVTHRGLVEMEEARLYVRPEIPPMIFGAAITPETAEWAGSWADGLITVYQPDGGMEKVIEAFRRGGGEGKRLCLQAQHSYGGSYEEALAGAFDQWRPSVLPSEVTTDLRFPKQIDGATALAKPDEVAKRVRVSASAAEHAGWIEEYRDLGFDEVYVHNVNRDQRPFIEAFGRDVLPRFR